MSRPRLTRLAPIALGVAIFAAAPGAARNFTLTVDPPYPTWQDHLELVVSGEAATACGAAAVRLRTTSIDWEDHHISLELSEPCGVVGPAVEEPFTVRVAMPLLINVPWTVNIRDVVEKHDHFEDLLVYDISPFEVELPDLVLAGEETTAIIRGTVSCNANQTQAHVELQDGVVAVTIPFSCLPITNPPGGSIEREIVIPALPPGDHVVRLVSEAGGFAEGVRFFPFRAWDPQGCLPSDTSLCLQNGRFRVEGTWRDFHGNEGVAHSAPLTGNESTGLLWFFGPENTELTVKVLEGCPLGGYWWVFVTSGSTVEYELTVTDTTTGEARTYSHEIGELPELIADTHAFGCG
jgi:hypothetical protein